MSFRSAGCHALMTHHHRTAVYGKTYFISIFYKYKPRGEGIKWPSQVYTGHLRQAETVSLLNGNVMLGPRNYSLSSLKAFPCSSRVVNALWWTSDERQGAPSTHAASPVGSSSVFAAIQGAIELPEANGRVAISFSKARILSSSYSPASFSVQCLN